MIALLTLHGAAQAPVPKVTTEGYTIFLRGAPVGREEITFRVDAAGTTITSQGRTQSPAVAVLQHVEFRYDSAGSPELFVLDGTLDGAPVNLRTNIKDGAAITQGSQQGKAVSFTQKVSPNAVMISNGVFGGFAALPPRLAAAAPGDVLRMFILPTAEVSARVAAVTDERMQTGTTLLNVRRHELVLTEAGVDTTVNVVTSAEGALVRVTIPSQSLDVLRDDLAVVTSRTEVYSNPGDEAVLIAAPGFNLGATITLPRAGAPAGTAARLPAVILLTGLDAPDRDGLAPGVPAIGQLAGTLADAGFIAVRYDRRGSAQSGGRSESATLSDYADDARAVLKWLTARKDVDPRRVALVGHSEGAWMALLAASRENRIAAVVTLAGPASSGADLILEQQQLQLDEMQATDADRAAKVALQKQIHSAVLTGKGWEQIPADVRRQADTPWFQSLLAYDPGKVVNGIEAPILIVHGELDHEVPVAHAERLSNLAQKGNSRSVELVTVRGVNHLMLPAFTGEVKEYATLTGRTISKDVAATVAGWLTKTLPAPRSR